MQEKNDALEAQKKYESDVDKTQDKIENFDILETITNVGNDEVFTPKKVCDMMLDSLPEEVWHHPEYHWLNPCTKNGIFEREIALRLDKGLKDKIPDEITRRKHILQKMIFSIGLTKFTSEVARRTLYYCNEANRKCDGIRGEDGHFVNGFAIGNGTWFDTPEGNIKTPKADHKFEKERCIYCGIQSDSKYVIDPIQNEKYAYEFIHHDSDGLKKYLAEEFFGGNQNMHFDIIIGNPPYQLSTNKEGIQAAPIYHKFIRQAIDLKPKYLSMIVPARWFTGGIGMDDFRKEFLNDSRIQMIHDFPKSRDCFANVDIAGGVCYFLWNSNYNNRIKKTQIISEYAGKQDSVFRPLNEYPIFIRDNTGINIIRKIHKISTIFLNSKVGSISPFGIPTTLRGEKAPFSDCITLISSTGLTYIKKEQVLKGTDIISKYKVSIGQLNPDRGGVNNASDGKSRVTTTIKIYKPGEVFTATYLLLGSFETFKEAEYFTSYIKTKFVRYLIFLTLTSMHITKDNFRFVPFQKYDHIFTDEELNKGFTA